MKDRKNRKFEYMILLIIIFVLYFIGDLIFCFQAESKIQKLQENIYTLENKIVELDEQIEAYSDNYVALWTTLNNITNNKVEDK